MVKDVDRIPDTIYIVHLFLSNMSIIKNMNLKLPGKFNLKAENITITNGGGQFISFITMINNTYRDISPTR